MLRLFEILIIVFWFVWGVVMILCVNVEIVKVWGVFLVVGVFFGFVNVLVLVGLMYML